MKIVKSYNDSDIHMNVEEYYSCKNCDFGYCWAYGGFYDIEIMGLKWFNFIKRKRLKNLKKKGLNHES
jgi:hypothetical protein